MKNKLLILLIVLATALSLCACTQTIPITRYEKRVNSVGAYTSFAKNLPYEVFLGLFAYYRSGTDDTADYEIYLPKEGEFVTEDGEVFVSRVDNVIYYNARTRGVQFSLCIYAQDGTLIVSEEILSARDSDDETPPEITVSEQMAPYWNIVKALPDELLAQ